MGNLEDKLIEYAYAAAELGVHAVDSDDMTQKLEPLIDMYIADIKRIAFSEVINESAGKRKMLTIEKADLWMNVLADFNSGMPRAKIAERYYNPVTKKPYTRAYIYWVIDRLKHPNIQEAIKNLKQR